MAKRERRTEAEQARVRRTLGLDPADQPQVLVLTVDEAFDQADGAGRAGHQAQSRVQRHSLSEPLIHVAPGPGQPKRHEYGQRRQVGQGEAEVLPGSAGMEGIHDGRPPDDQQ